MMSIALSEKLHITYGIDNLSTNLTLVARKFANLFCDVAYLTTLIFSVSILLMRLLFFVMLFRLRKDYWLLT